LVGLQELLNLFFSSLWWLVAENNVLMQLEVVGNSFLLWIRLLVILLAGKSEERMKFLK
jgi:hypothetical protein